MSWSAVSTPSDSDASLKNEKVVVLKEGNLLYSKLQCVLCGNCLSVKPVSLADGKKRGIIHNGQYTCGRCRPESQQCQLYEVFAEHLTFTCIFEGCDSLLNWGEAKAHENICKHREISCPFIECTDMYSLKNSQSHFSDVHSLHKKSYSSDPISLENLNSSKQYVNLHCMLCEGVIFLIFIRVYKRNHRAVGVCQYSVFFISNGLDCSKLEMELKIHITSDLTLTKVIDCNNILQFFDRYYCTSCLYGSCDRPDHKFDIDFVTNVLNFYTVKKNTISYAIKIYKKRSSVQLSNLECPICFHVFGEKIYLCPSGHSLCEKCAQKTNLCPFCRVAIPFEHIRNFALENVIKEYRDSL